MKYRFVDFLEERYGGMDFFPDNELKILKKKWKEWKEEKKEKNKGRKAVDKHGIKMRGLKSAAGETKCLKNTRGCSIQVSYNYNTGEIITDFLHGEDLVWYHDRDISQLFFIGAPMTMQEIADRVADELAFDSQVRKNYY